MISITEDQLSISAKCLLMTERPKDPMHETALATWKKCALASMDGVLYPTSVIREKYTTYWKLTYYPEFKDKPVPPEHPTFWKGPKQAARVAKRIHDFLRRYTMVSVNLSYSAYIPTDGYITGIVHIAKNKSESTSLVVIPHVTVQRYSQFPEVGALAKWYAATIQQSDRVSPVHLYHLPLFHGKPWKDKDIKLQRALAALSDAYSALNKRHPSPGSHCENCISHRCLEIYE